MVAMEVAEVERREEEVGLGVLMISVAITALAVLIVVDVATVFFPHCENKLPTFPGSAPERRVG